MRSSKLTTEDGTVIFTPLKVCVGQHTQITNISTLRVVHKQDHQQDLYLKQMWKTLLTARYNETTVTVLLIFYVLFS